MIDDARVVLEWMGYEAPKAEGSQYWRRERDWRCTLPHEGGVCGHVIDANWIMGTLVPALEERLGLWLIARLHGGEVRLTFKGSEWGYFHGTGPTFESAVLAAAAAAIRSMGDA